MDHVTKGRRYLRKRAVAERYGLHERSVDRKAATGALPKPHYPVGDRVPLWAEDELDEHDRKAGARGKAA
jgi:predicted DNA-binding transcriptional regulator AlpA